MDAMEALSRSGWLSREQVAANEFARRVGVEHGLGLAPAAAAQWRKRHQVGRGREVTNLSTAKILLC